jgi:hypothetical protein
MIITIDQLEQIAAAGGGLILDASSMPFNQIKQISAAANNGKAKIVIKNLSGLTAIQLMELAALAPGLIIFDQTS